MSYSGQRRVLLVSHAYIAPENRLKLRLLAKESELGVIFPSKWPTWHGQSLEATKESTRYKFFPISSFFAGDGSKYFYNPLKLFRAISKFRPDIIHVEEEPWSRVLFETAFLNKIFFHKRMIFFTWENLELKPSPFQRLMRRFVFSNVALAIAGNSEAKERLKEADFDKKIEVLPQFGVNTDHFRPLHPSGVRDYRKKLGLCGFVVGYVGRFVPEKGIDTLFEAVFKLKGEWRLLLVSTTKELPPEFENLAGHLGIRDRVIIASGVSHEEMPKYMNLVDSLVLPSKTTPTWKEQFGRVLIEAMACKVPVIGSSSGAIPEVTGEAGIIFKEGDAAGLALKIESLMKDEKYRKELAEKGYRRILSHYTFEKIVEKTLEIYSKV